MSTSNDTATIHALTPGKEQQSQPRPLTSATTKWISSRWLVGCIFLIPAIIAIYLSQISRPPSAATPGTCQPGKDKHCWGITTPFGLRGEGPRDRSQIGTERATLLMLVRNRELEDTLFTMKQIEDRFNRYYCYPWTFLNDEPFTEEFKNYTSIMASGETEYGLVPTEHWNMPEWIDELKFRVAAKRMEDEGVAYGESKTYRNMCRYFSGWFWRHPLVEKYEWYWRIEPNIRFPCDQLYDPFTYLREHNKTFSFTIALPEYPNTIETLWSVVGDFARLHPQYIAEDNSLGFVSLAPELGLHDSEYNLCHFWSNFEIGSLQFFRSKAYRDYFDHLDRSGGFYYERWGDAPVHSLAAALFLNKNEIHFWHDVGYYHVPWGRCPWEAEEFDNGRCAGCKWVGGKSFDWHRGSCLFKWMEISGHGEWWEEFRKQ